MRRNSAHAQRRRCAAIEIIRGQHEPFVERIVVIAQHAVGVGDLHVANAEAAENIHDCLAGLRVERIDETGNEELDGCHKSILIHLNIWGIIVRL